MKTVQLESASGVTPERSQNLHREKATDRSLSTLFMCEKCTLVAVLLAVFLFVPGRPLVVAAHDSTPVAEEAESEDVSFEFLAQATVEEFLPAPTGVGVVRLTVDPGASDQPEPGSDVTLAYLETGSLTFHFDGPATITREGMSGTPSPQEETILSAGDAVFVPTNVGFTVRNDGTEPAQVLVVGAFAMEAAGTHAAEEDVEEEAVPGIAFQALGFGLATDIPAPPLAIGLVRVTVAPGARVPPEELHAGPEIIIVESGSFAVTLTGGDAQVFRGLSMATPDIQPGPAEMAAVGTKIALNTEDVFFAQTGSAEEAHNSGDVPAVALVAFFAPAAEAEGEEAEVAEHGAGTPTP